jgi:hypothetical protein
MNETRLQIKACQTQIMIKDLKVMLNRLENIMIDLQNDDKNLTRFDNLLKNLDKDHTLWSQGLSENINEIRDMINES